MDFLAVIDQSPKQSSLCFQNFKITFFSCQDDMFNVANVKRFMLSATVKDFSKSFIILSVESYNQMQ